ncbi:Copia protein, partial [Mucuna pruriens]
MKLQYERPVQMYVDNKSAINMSKNPVSHGKSKHIETKYHFLRDQFLSINTVPAGHDDRQTNLRQRYVVYVLYWDRTDELHRT